MLLKFFLFFAVSVISLVFCSADGDVVKADGQLITVNGVAINLSCHPATDLLLTEMPRLSRPPFYSVTFPSGQKLIFLGTMHVLPAVCYSSCALMRDLVGASGYLFGEIGNDCQSNRIDLSSIFVTAKDIDKFRESSQKFNSQFFTESKVLAEKVEADLANTFNGLSWYEKSGIICDADDFDISFGAPPYYYKFLRIGGKIVRVTTNENNAAILPSILYYHCVDSQKDGVDHQLMDFSKRVVESLDTEEINCKKLTSQPREQDLFAINANISAIVACERTIDMQAAEHYAPAEADLYSSPSVGGDFVITYRNKVWFERLQQLRDSHSRLNFCWVGLAHLPDLFARFTEVGCTVSERLCLSDIEGILHERYLQEHIARVAAMKKAFGGLARKA